VVDDDADARLSIEAFLATLGYDVHSFPSAEAFLDRLGNFCPDCLITDVRMQGTDRFALQRELSRVAASLPVIVMTGYATTNALKGAWSSSAVTFLEKPIDPVTLLRHIETVIR
jgi:FixJ family two-component response regulator